MINKRTEWKKRNKNKNKKKLHDSRDDQLNIT